MNYLRSHKSKNNKSHLFLCKLVEEVIDRLNLKKSNHFNILELFARNNVFELELKRKNFNFFLHQTKLSSKLYSNSKNLLSDELKISNYKNFNFDYCISFFSIYSPATLQEVLKYVNKVLKKDGKFLFAFHSSNSLAKFKEVFIRTTNFDIADSFLPTYDMLSLGNLANSIGFKNVVVDQSEYLLTITKPREIWDFIRSLGENNYLIKRNKSIIKKSKYLELCDLLNPSLTKEKSSTNQIFITFLIGTK